jgi:putative ABC transport system permease protein
LYAGTADYVDSLPEFMRAFRLVLRDAWRSLRATPTASAFVLVLLALGISSATVTFSVVDAVVLRPLPFPDPNRLAVVEVRSELFRSATSAPAFLFEQIRARSDAFAGLAAARRGRETLVRNSTQESVLSAAVTANVFDVLGIRPFLGQPFTAANEVDGNSDVAVIGYGLWQRWYAADPSIVGRPLHLAKRTLTIVGVMPRGFSYPLAEDLRPELWTPLVVPEDERSGAQLSRYLHVVGRLSPGMSVSEAKGQVEALFSSLAVPGPSSLQGQRVDVRLLNDVLLAPVRGWMLLVLAAVSLVLLVACANAANILLTRVTRRARDLSVRASIGASRRHLMASVLTESLILSCGAVALGLLLAWWDVDIARSSLPTGIARTTDIALDLRVVAVAVLAALVTGLTFGAVPAWHAARHDLVTLLKESSTSTTAGRPRWRAAFLVAQMAFVSLLLVVTTLFVTSFVRVSRADLGFERRNLLAASVSGLTAPVADVINELERAPGVTAVGAFQNGSAPLAMAGGFGGGASGTSVRRADASSGQGSIEVLFLRTAPGYFAAAGTRILRGRDFSDTDYGRTDAVVIDATLGRLLFDSADPVGKNIELRQGPVVVIGVVADVRDRGPEAESSRMIYMPARNAAGGYAFIVRTDTAAAPVIPAVQAAFDRLRSPGGQPAVVRPIEDAFRTITADRRFAADVMLLFGVLALLIGAAGLYGVMTALVEQRTREIGIRMALGADPPTIVTSILIQAGRYLAAGLAIGLPAGVLISRGFGSVFYQVQPTDVSIYFVVAAIILAVGIAASGLPARRAARIDPQITLRTE